jgi:Ca2+-binding EF-hand superfamily protein
MGRAGTQRTGVIMTELPKDIEERFDKEFGLLEIDTSGNPDRTYFRSIYFYPTLKKRFAQELSSAVQKERANAIQLAALAFGKNHQNFKEFEKSLFLGTPQPKGAE